MIEKQSISDQRIIDCLQTHYDIKVATITFLLLGADINASIYKAKTHDQSSYFIKIKRGDHHEISEDIAGFGQQLLFSSGERQNRVKSYKYFIVQFEPQGVVDIAFKTDEKARSIPIVLQDSRF